MRVRGKRFDDLLAMIAVETDACIEWPFAKVDDGYGTITINYKPYRVTHISWEIHNKLPIPEGKRVCHSCDNPPCINPKHLFIGTNSENMQDASRKHRIAHGVRCHSAKLTDEIVREIRTATHLTRRELAKKYGVSEANISQVRLRRTWAHVA